MREHGISPPPRAPLISHLWPQWFERIFFAMPRVQTFTPILDPASVPAGSTSEQTFTVAGLSTSDVVTVNKPSHTSGLGIAGARVSAADTLAITFVNVSGAAIDPPSEQYQVVAVRL